MNTATLREEGYTLVELIVAIIVGAIFAGSLTTAIVNQSYLAQRGRDVTLANSYVENKVEELRSIGYLGLTDGTTDVTNELPSELKNPRSGSLVISTHVVGIKKAIITVSYSEQGISRTYSYTTMIGELGVGQY